MTMTIVGQLKMVREGIKKYILYFRSKGGGVLGQSKKTSSENTQTFWTNFDQFWPIFDQF